MSKKTMLGIVAAVLLIGAGSLYGQAGRDRPRFWQGQWRRGQTNAVCGQGMWWNQTRGDWARREVPDRPAGQRFRLGWRGRGMRYRGGGGPGLRGMAMGEYARGGWRRGRRGSWQTGPGWGRGRGGGPGRAFMYGGTGGRGFGGPGSQRGRMMMRRGGGPRPGMSPAWAPGRGQGPIGPDRGFERLGPRGPARDVDRPGPRGSGEDMRGWGPGGLGPGMGGRGAPGGGWGRRGGGGLPEGLGRASPYAGPGWADQPERGARQRRGRTDPDPAETKPSPPAPDR